MEPHFDEAKDRSHGLPTEEEALADRRLVGTLLETLARADRQTRDECMEILARVLPQLEAEDAPLLTPQHRAILARCMANRNPPMKDFARYLKLYTAFTVAALQALPKIGDTSSLPIVERLAARNNPDASTRLAAQACLPRLQERLQNRAAGGSLLRPAGASSTSEAANSLLRASAPGPSQTDPKHLLRPGNRDPSDA